MGDDAQVTYLGQGRTAFCVEWQQIADLFPLQASLSPPITQVRYLCMFSRSHLEQVCKCPHPEDSAHFHLAVKYLSYCSPSNALETLVSDTHLLSPAPKGWIPSTSAKLGRAPRAHLPLPQPERQPRCDVTGFLQNKTVSWFPQPWPLSFLLLAPVDPVISSSLAPHLLLLCERLWDSKPTMKLQSGLFEVISSV